MEEKEAEIQNRGTKGDTGKKGRNRNTGVGTTNETTTTLTPPSDDPTSSPRPDRYSSVDNSKGYSFRSSSGPVVRTKEESRDGSGGVGVEGKKTWLKSRRPLERKVSLIKTIPRGFPSNFHYTHL